MSSVKSKMKQLWSSIVANAKHLKDLTKNFSSNTWRRLRSIASSSLENWKSIAIGGYTSLWALLLNAGYTPQEIVRFHGMVVTGALDIGILLLDSTHSNSDNLLDIFIDKAPRPNPFCTSDGDCRTITEKIFFFKARKSARKSVRKSSRKSSRKAKKSVRKSRKSRKSLRKSKKSARKSKKSLRKAKKSMRKSRKSRKSKKRN